MVTVTVPPGATDSVSNDLLALGTAPSCAPDPVPGRCVAVATLTLLEPPTEVSTLSESLSVPEKSWVPAVSEAVTV